MLTGLKITFEVFNHFSAVAVDGDLANLSRVGRKGLSTKTNKAESQYKG
jgi:hypothetical protein